MPFAQGSDNNLFTIILNGLFKDKIMNDASTTKILFNFINDCIYLSFREFNKKLKAANI